MKPTDLDSFIGRRGVYIEDGIFCVVKVSSTSFDHRRMIAEVESVSDLIYDVRQKRFARRGSPFGKSWEISQDWDFFFLDDDYRDGSLQMGFRVVFDRGIVGMFEKEDILWIDEFF